MVSFLGHLLRSTDHWRLLAEDVLQIAQKLRQARPVPHLGPISQVGMIHSAIDPYMLARPDRHVLARRNVYVRGLQRVGMGQPDLEWEMVRRATEDHGQSACERQQQGRRAIHVGVYVGARGERRVEREGARGVGVGALRVVVFLAGTIRSCLSISSVLRPQSACPRTCSTLYSHDSTLSGIAALVCAMVVVDDGGGDGGDVSRAFMLALLPCSVFTSRHVLAARPRQSNGSCRCHLPLLSEECVYLS